MSSSSTRTKQRKSASTSQQQWEVVEKAVKPDLATLKSMDTHRDLYAWAVANSLNTATLFPKLKRTWLKYGIDYVQLREERRSAEFSELMDTAADAPLVILYCFADPEHEVYAVCGEDGEQAWYGTFHEKDRYYESGQSQFDADYATADKAVYLAGKVAEEIGVPAVRLELRTFNHEIAIKHLTVAALKNRVALSIEIVQDSNPAEEWAMAHGFANIHDINLANLVHTESS